MENTIVNKLESIKSKSDNALIKRVIEDALELHGDEAQTWLEDVRQYGCQSGSVSGLIYYNDTHAFFNEYISEIEEIFFQVGEEIGEQPKIKEGDIRNWFAWFGYEWAVGEVLNELENYNASEYPDREEQE